MMFVVTQNGTIRHQKRFDYAPASIILNNFPENKALVVEPNGEKLSSLFFVISSFTHHILVYQDFQLLWAAKTDHVCHGLALGQFDNQKGLITVLNDEGWLQVIYLGTETPSIQQEFGTVSKMNFEEMNHQYLRLIENINKKENSQGSNMEQQNVSFKVHAHCSEVKLNSGYIEDSQLYYKSAKGIHECKIQIQLTSSLPCQNLKIDLHTDKGTIVIPNSFTYERYNPDQGALTFTANVYASSKWQPIQRIVNVTAVAQAKPPEARNLKTFCSQQAIPIPLSLYASLLPPTKQAEFKITVTVVNPIELFTLFQDLVKLCNQPAECTSNPNGMTAQLCSGSEVTLLLSKNLDKWRIQSNDFESINVMMDEILKRVQNTKTQLSFVDQIPLADIFQVIEDHYTLRLSNIEFEKDLEAKAIEFRSIQKKLLSRFKEKNPSSTQNLDLLLNASFESMLQLIDTAQKCQEALEASDHKLQIISQLLLNLIYLRFNITPQLFTQISRLLPTQAFEGPIGWEEVAYGNINYFLRSMMKKEEKNNIPVAQFAPIEDINKLKKIITILIDKISKGVL